MEQIPPIIGHVLAESRDTAGVWGRVLDAFLARLRQ
jgi:hypothetical protein